MYIVINSKKVQQYSQHFKTHANGNTYSYAHRERNLLFILVQNSTSCKLDSTLDSNSDFFSMLRWYPDYLQLTPK